MTVRLLAVTYHTHEPDRVADFWAGLLGRDRVQDHRGVLLPGTSTQVGLRFVGSDLERSGRDHVHLHLASTSAAAQQQTVDDALALGAHHLDVGQRPEEGHVVLADPEGNELCVIEPRNTYLAGCGFLAEVACDGTQEVGLFWSAALGWPLVWEEGEETAIQSPAGGTKVAWGGPPLLPRSGHERQHLDLAAPADDLAGEVDRLVALGATWSGAAGDGAVALLDPDDRRFRICPAGE